MEDMKIKYSDGSEVEIDPEDFWLYAPMETIEATAEVGGLDPKTGKMVFVPLKSLK